MKSRRALAAIVTFLFILRVPVGCCWNWSSPAANMLILAVDTSGKNGSLALVRSEKEHLHTFEIVPLEGGTFSAQLIPQIADSLTKHKLTKEDIDAFAVVSGPGSFTGLRVGLAAIKALAEILKKPIVAVSLLEAVALAAGIDDRMLAALDAGRGEVYC